jgi:hypothetical protein
MTRSLCLPMIAILIASLHLPAADPPAKPATDKPAAKGEKPKAKLPTTKAEFKAVAEKLPRPPWIADDSGRQEAEDRGVWGVVVRATADNITIRPDGEKEDVTYPAHILLVTGAVCHWEDDPDCYLLPDVRKGDEVRLTVGTVDKDVGMECFCITIRKRPGGEVPPSRKPEGDEPWHVRQTQAYLDKEAKKAQERRDNPEPKIEKKKDDKK